MSTYERDPYSGGYFVEKLRKNGILIISDFDGTQTTGDESPTEKELNDRKEVLDIAERVGGVTVAVTARNHGLTLSEKMFRASVLQGLTEPEPHWYKNPVTGRHEYVDPARVPFFRHNTDWDVSSSFGRGILIRNGKGYFLDHVFDSMLRYDWATSSVSGAEPEPWRSGVLRFVDQSCPEARSFMAEIESEKNYLEGKTNVAPLDYRVQFNFAGSAGYAVMMMLLATLQLEKEAGNRLALRIHVVDESRLHDELEKCRYVLYLIPWHGRKESMINRILSQTARAADRRVEDVRMFYAGDTLTDLRAGLYAGGDAKMMFLLATGSRLSPYLLGRQNSYGIKDLSFLWEKPVKGRPKPRLVPTGEKGVYEFVVSARAQRNTVIIGDERYPGTTPPGSVAAFLKEFV